MLGTALRSPACLFLTLAACSCGATGTGSPSAREPTASPTEATEATEPSGEAGYEVHEWGLVRGGPGDTLTASAIAPPVVVMPVSVDKPVLYFHTSAPFTLRSARVHAEGGSIVEHWPPTPLTAIASDVGWYGVEVDPSGPCDLSPLPTDCGPSIDPSTFCEVPSLGTVRAEGSACMRAPGGTDSMLFYRARSGRFTPPLVFSRTSVYERVEVRNDGDEPIPGMLVRLHSSGGQVVALAVTPPAPHESIEVGVDFAAAADDEANDEDMPAMAGSPQPGRQAVQASLRELGMTDAETAAFLRAWDAQLFGLTSVDTLMADGVPSDRFTDLDPAPVDSFVYFLPAASCDRLASLTFDPPPRAVRRAIAMWSRVPAAGASR